ncbi:MULTISPECIES: methyl-accepting chemotaxis protein [unclassified Clostridium]|uniref:methyl-accepting chemotaxis protein n=1 Tax=unclassified Clostridium TaxID=2614128 RepID=UPI000297C20A|nr:MULTISPECIES: methyl-accepting chemotaxis protein [unclassified Clostridium]EKQ50381.1 MAG: methyl-accepting chemotaxis protein [Clostridium sp. Maddingley MBC34-26]
MKWFNDIKIRVKILAGFIIVAFIAGIVGIVGISKIKEVNKNYSDLYINYGVAIGDIADVSISYQRLKINLDNIILYNDASKIINYKDKINNYEKELKASLLLVEKSIQTEEGKKELANLEMLLDKYISIKDNIMELADSGKKDEALKLMGSDETQEVSDAINASVDNLLKLKSSGGINKSNEYTAEVNYSVITMVITIAIAAIIAIFFGIIISRLISKPISELMNVTNEISKGNLDVKITNNSKDEIGVLSKSMKKMQYKLNEVIEHISFAAEQVTVGSRQISDSTIALSQGATEQASAVEELTASIEEISAQINVNAENAKEANNIANSTKISAVKRNNEMKLMLSAMDEINNSSNNVSKIIKVIDEIAFQTNILALNAAVEAARAGQYGKGFTVVAEEVRNLAARSANAAKETTNIIEESLIKIQDGTGIANQTADALENIVKDIEKVAGIVNGITEACDEQATGISQISQGVIQISQVVQSNSATAEESAASSEELAGQAEVLREQVQMFNIKSNKITPLYEEEDHLHVDSVIEGTYLNNKKFISKEAPRSKKENYPKKILLSDNEFGKY